MSFNASDRVFSSPAATAEEQGEKAQADDSSPGVQECDLSAAKHICISTADRTTHANSAAGPTLLAEQARGEESHSRLAHKKKKKDREKTETTQAEEPARLSFSFPYIARSSGKKKAKPKLGLFSKTKQSRAEQAGKHTHTHI